MFSFTVKLTTISSVGFFNRDFITYKNVFDKLEEIFVDSDATLSSCDGVISLAFDREAASYTDAVKSAMDQIIDAELPIRFLNVEKEK